MEEGHAGRPGRPEGGGRRPQVRRPSSLPRLRLLCCCFFFFLFALSSSPQPTLNAASLLLLCLHSNDSSLFQEDLLNIARTTLSSKLLTHHKDHFSQLAVDAVVRLKGSGNLDAIHVIKKLGGSLTDSYLDEGEDAAVLVPPAPG